jgi:DNA-binding NtrC family response regulator
VRIIAATHKDLREESRLGNFRSDLYYRLNVLIIEIPPLRERSTDLPLLVQHFLQRQGSIVGRSLAITAEALDALGQYSWPGNVRELENMLERVTYLTTKPIITVDDLPLEFRRPPDAAMLHTTALAEEKVEPIIAVSNSTVKVLKDHSMNAEAQAILQA